jgi:hypothetical protein
MGDRTEDVLGAGGIAIDRSMIEGRQRSEGAHLFGEHVAIGGGQVHVDRRQ